MGTRADFYVRKETEMRWLGSKAFDGYPDGIKKNVLKAKSEEAFIKNTEKFLQEHDDSTFPEQGWPWPWEDSRTTDYAYIYENGKVMSSCFGGKLFDPLKANEDDEEDSKIEENYFPDMSSVKNVQMGGKRSGMMIFGFNSNGDMSIQKTDLLLSSKMMSLAA